MAQFRPAGLSDEDDSDDDYGFYEKPAKTSYQPIQQNEKKRLENKLLEHIMNGNIEEVERIITNDLHNNVNLKLDSGWTLLMHACFHAQEKIVNYLLDKGADPNSHADSVTPIMAACSNSSANNDTIYEIVKSLIEKESILNIGDKYGQTALMRAIGSGRVAVVQLLLEKGVNIEMRDNKGWTAVFWACHHNQPEILEMLIGLGARLSEVDKSDRTPIDIATTHDYQNIVEILEKEMVPNGVEGEGEKIIFFDPLKSWQDYYPGIQPGQKPNYASEIPQLLYGMRCERLMPIIEKAGIDLKTFLLLDESNMIQLGIEMPYERQRLKKGLRNFHTRSWKLNAVVGLYARKSDNYSVLDCLTSLGTHLHQIYILEATLQYTLRELNKDQNQIKFEPPDSQLVARMVAAAKKMLTNINSIRREDNNLKKRLVKISRNNPEPADLIKDKSTQQILKDYMTEIVMICSVGLMVYHAKKFIVNIINK